MAAIMAVSLQYFHIWDAEYYNLFTIFDVLVVRINEGRPYLLVNWCSNIDPRLVNINRPKLVNRLNIWVTCKWRRTFCSSVAISLTVTTIAIWHLMSPASICTHQLHYYYYYYYYFIPLVSRITRDLKIIDIRNCRSNHYSRKSSRTNESWSRMLLNRCNKTEIRWKKKTVSRSSPERWLILCAKTVRKWKADLLIGPSVSTSVG